MGKQETTIRSFGIKNDARGKKHNSPKATAGQEVDVDIDDGSRYEPMEADPGGAR